MTCSRWVRVCVDMLDHPVVGASVPPPKPNDPSRHAMQPALAWLDLISAAAWKAHDVHHKGKILTLQRGEFLAARSYWSKRWNWGEQAVRSFFSRLCSSGMVAISNQSNGHTSNIASICNYDTYQNPKGDAQPEKKPEANQSLTSAQPEGNQTVDRDTSSTKDTSRDNPTTVEQDAARESDRPADELKSAFNGQTESMLAEVATHMQGDTAAARRWLLTTLQTYDQQSVKEAWLMMETARHEGQTILMPLRWWSKTASTLKAKSAAAAVPQTPKPKPKIQYHKPDWYLEARANMEY